MKKCIKSYLLLVIATSLLLSSCSHSYIISSGAKDNKPLIFNNEYETKKLNEITVDGEAFWGIPSFSKNNQHNRKYGMLFTFNGVQLGKTPRILPMATLIGYSLGLGYMFGPKSSWNYSSYYNEYYPEPYNYYGLFIRSIIFLPIAGALNNITWPNAAASGAGQTLNYRLIDENPEVDVFFYPKYNINRSIGFWKQKANIKANVSGATLKLKTSGK